MCAPSFWTLGLIGAGKAGEDEIGHRGVRGHAQFGERLGQAAVEPAEDGGPHAAPAAAETGCAYGVDFTIASSSGVISAGTLANNGVDRYRSPVSASMALRVSQLRSKTSMSTQSAGVATSRNRAPADAGFALSARAPASS